MICTITLVTFLFLCSITDVRKRKIPLLLCLLWLVMGLLITIFYLHTNLLTLCLNLSTGLFLTVLSQITHGGIGMGDAIIFIIMSFFLTNYGTLYILFWALLTAVIPCLILLIQKHNRKASIPFAPFILMGYLIVIVT